MATGYGLYYWDSIASGGRNVSLGDSFHICSGVHPLSYPVGTVDSFLKGTAGGA
jgi:hypothetical protein